MFLANRSILLAALALIVSTAGNSGLAREQRGGPKGDVDPKTGMRFPPRSGAFQRERGIGYDTAGYPETAYILDRAAFASVFYYKNLPFSAEYANCRDAVRQKTPSAKLISDEPSNIHSGGRRAVFTFEDVLLGSPKTKLLSELLMYPRGDYYLTFRVTYRADQAERIRREIDSLVRAFKL